MKKKYENIVNKIRKAHFREGELKKLRKYFCCEKALVDILLILKGKKCLQKRNKKKKNKK